MLAGAFKITANGYNVFTIHYIWEWEWDAFCLVFFNTGRQWRHEWEILGQLPHPFCFLCFIFILLRKERQPSIWRSIREAALDHIFLIPSILRLCFLNYLLWHHPLQNRYPPWDFHIGWWKHKEEKKTDKEKGKKINGKAKKDKKIGLYSIISFLFYFLMLRT